jgi:hypothetical protein
VIALYGHYVFIALLYCAAHQYCAFFLLEDLTSDMNCAVMGQSIKKEYKMKNKLLKVCIAALVLPAAGLANAKHNIFTPELRSHVVISGGALSVTADSVVEGNLAAHAAVTIGAAASVGANAKAHNINAGDAITLGESADVKKINADAGITVGTNAKYSIIENWMSVSEFGDIKTRADMEGAMADINAAQTSLARMTPSDTAPYAFKLQTLPLV